MTRRANSRRFVSFRIPSGNLGLHAEPLGAIWQAVKDAVAAVGRAGYLALMFSGLYHGPLASPGLTHATVVSEEAAFVSYAVESTIATSLSCAFPLYRHASPPVRERYLPGIVEGRTAPWA